MSFCDDIRLLLREKEMSHAALSELLSVDETVVSGWELGSELPDKDTLSQLRSLFPEAELPVEIYSFRIEEDEAKSAFKCNRQKWLRRNIILCLLFAILGLAFMLMDIGTAAMVAFALDFVYICITLSPLAPLAKQNRKSLELFARSRYEYCVFPDRVCISSWEGMKRISEQSYFYANSILCIRTDRLLLPYFGNIYLPIPLRAIAHDSLLLTALEPKAVKRRTAEKAKAHKALRVISIVLLVISIIALPLGLLNIFAASLIIPSEAASATLVSYALPCVSLFYGLVLTILGKREGRKNILVASLVIILLSFTLIFCSRHITPAEAPDPDAPSLEEVMAKSEAALGIDIPQPEDSDLYSYNYGYDDFFVYYYGYLYFSPSEAQSFEEATDGFWLDHVPNTLKGICEDTSILDAYDSYLFYNMDSGEHNTLPAQTGQYRFMVLYYSTEYDEIYVAEYDLDYVE